MTDEELVARAAEHAIETFMLGRSFRNDREYLEARRNAVAAAVVAALKEKGRLLPERFNLFTGDDGIPRLSLRDTEPT